MIISNNYPASIFNLSLPCRTVRNFNNIAIMIFTSPVESIYYLLPFIGLAVGLFGTMVGGGGGLIFLPVLVLFLEIPAHTALITSLVATLPISLAGSLAHYRKGHVQFRIAGQFAAAGLVGAITGAAVANQFTEEGLVTGFGSYCIVIGLYIMVSTRKLTNMSKGNQALPMGTSGKYWVKSTFFGFSSGVITGAFGTSGAAPLMAGLFSLQLPVKVVIGTSLVVVASNTFFAIGGHFLVGSVDLTLVFFLTIGSIIGAWVGPSLISRVKTDNSENRIRYIFAVGIIILGIIMIRG